MADVVTKSVRLMDKEVRLYPRVKLEDIVKSVTADGTETVVKLVEQSNNENIVYGTKVTGGLLQQATITYSESLKGSTIPVRTAGGMLLVENPSSDTPQAAVNLLYANTTYGRLGAGNDWTGLNRFGAEKISVHATDNSIYMKLAEQGFFIKTGPSSEEYFVKLPDLAGTLTTEAALNSSAASTLSSAKSYTDTQIAANISSVLKYKGSVKTYADLPKTGNKIGDTWNVEAGYGEAHAGTNWAWNGTTWDPLGGTIDTSVFVKRTELGTGGDLDLTKKLDKQTTTGYFAYTHNGTTQNEIKISNAAEVNTLVSRDSAGEAYGVGMLVTGAMTDTADGSGTTLGTIGFTSSSLGLDALASASDIKRIVLAASNSLQNEHITLSNSISIETGKKVDKKTTSGNWIYSHTSATQNEIGYGTSATGSTIVQRTPDGGIILPDYDLTTLPPSSAAINHGYVIKLLASYSRITYEEI